MMVLSDGSANHLPSGFNTYITGYPLVEDSSYVLARTWEATDIHRPGAVWTYSLIIPFSLLPLMEDVGQLLALLFDGIRLPTKLLRKPIFVTPRPYTFYEASRPQMDRIIRPLYEFDEQAIVTGVESSLPYETAFLSLWTGQGPRLRRSFTFCTGSVTLRSFQGVPFDLQAVPLSTAAAKNLPERFRFVSSDLVSNDAHDWCNIALKVIEGDALSRKSIQRWSSDLAPTRRVHRQLCQIFVTTEDVRSRRSSLESLLGQLADFFPERKVGRQVKQELLGPQASDFFGISESGLLGCFLSIPFDSFDKSDLRLTERFQMAFLAGHLRFDECVERALSSDLHEEFFTAYAYSLNATTFIEFSRKYSTLVPIILQLNARIALDPTLWPVDTREIEVLVRSVVINFSDSMLKELFGELFPSRIDVLVEICRQVGADAVSILLEHLSLGVIDDSTLDAVRRTLVDHHTEVRSWLASQVTISSQLLHTVIESMEAVGFTGIDEMAPVDFEVLLRLTKCSYEKALSVHPGIWSYCFRLGVDHGSIEGLRLSLRSFSALYRKAEDRSLPYPVLLNLDRWLPSLGVFMNWDYCRRLSMAFASRFSKNDIAVEASAYLFDARLLPTIGLD